MAGWFGRRKDPVEVRVVALPEGIAEAVGLAARLAALEAREAELRETIARLEGRLEEMARAGGGGGMRFGAVLPPGPEEAAPEAEEIAAGELVGRLGEEIARAHPEDSPFTLDDVEVDVKGALGGGREGPVMLGLSSKRAPTAETASSLRFTLRRKTRAKVVK
jgi:hypothetical protein